MDLNALAAQLAEVRASVAQSHQHLNASRRSLNAIKVTTQSRDGDMTLTLDALGQPEELTFRTDDYRDLEPEELSAKIIALFSEARAELQKAVMDQLPPSPFSGLSMQQMLDPGADLMDVFPESLLNSLLTGPSDDDRGPRHG
jgi:hypothetical protein